jgi:predicted O-linked N-acetylglucosamine transferase (SPINDLY family)
LLQAAACHARGELVQAAALYSEIISRAPAHFEALHLLGVLEHQRGRHEAALAGYERALAVKPGDAEVLHNRGVALQALGRNAEALESYDAALASTPDSHQCLYSRGNALHALGRNEEAVASYERAVALAPGHAQAHYNRGNALRDLERDDEALASYDRALASRPDFAEALSNRGNALLALNRHEDALASYDQALALEPHYAQALNNRGNALRSLGRRADALASYERAVAANPDDTDALSNCAHVLRELKRYEEAAACFERLIAIAPHDDYAAGERLACLMACCAWQDFEARRRRVLQAVLDGKKAATPFSFLAISDSAQAQLQCARTYAADRYPAASRPLWTGERYRHDRIRVAYLSANFHNHAQASLIARLFELHDDARFEITAISFGPRVDDPVRKRLQRSFRRFVDVTGKRDVAVAQMLRADEVDIAVDLKGYSNNCRPGIFAHRAVPIQVNYLGFPGTTGADYVDYILADASVIPAGNEAFFSERAVRLPDAYQVNDATRAIAERTPTRAEAGLPDVGFVFCSFNNNYKITPDVFDVWMRLLGAAPGSVLWLLDDNPAASRNLRQEAARRGVAPERLVFAPRLPHAEHLARHRLADLFLDTLPCNAHTTASDALWVGLPVVTCTGDAFASRVAASLLRAVGLPELVTGSLEAYEALATTLTTGRAMLADVKTRLARNRSPYPLFDTERFRRHIEAAYETMWERCQRGEPPSGFTVQSIDVPDRVTPAQPFAEGTNAT